MIVLKFGGTSVSTVERLHTIIDIVLREKARQPIVVVSAIRGVTDLLLSLVSISANEQQLTLEKIKQIHLNLIKDFFDSKTEEKMQKDLALYITEIQTLLKSSLIDNAELLDTILSYGERMSSQIVKEALVSAGIDSQQVLAVDCIVTDNHFGSAEFLPDETRIKTKRCLLPLLKRNVIPVVTGFMGATRDGRITTLGRGGSDYSAAIIGYALHTEEIQIWTDVDGIYSADPNIVATATYIPTISYREASELAAFGAKVLHPRTMKPALNLGIPVRVCNTLNRESKGTQITTIDDSLARVTAVASKNQVTLINMYSTEMLHSKGFLQRIFTIFAKHNISIDLVSVSEVSVSVTLDNNENMAKAIVDLEEFTSVTTLEVGMVSLIGEKIVKVPSLMRFIFSMLEKESIPVHMVSLGASEINISLIVDTQFVTRTVKNLHDLVIAKSNSGEEKYL